MLSTETLKALARKPKKSSAQTGVLTENHSQPLCEATTTEELDSFIKEIFMGSIQSLASNEIAKIIGTLIKDMKVPTSALSTGATGGAATLEGVGSGILSLIATYPAIATIVGALTLCGGAAIANEIRQEKAAAAIKAAYEDAKISVDGINNTYEGNSSKTREIAKEYAELAQGVNLLTNENKNLSTEKYERFLALSQQLSSFYPSLTKDFDENGTAILDLSGDINTIIESLDNLIDRQRQLANEEIAEKMPALFAGYSSQMKNHEEQVTEAEKTRDNIQNAYELLRDKGRWTFKINGTADNGVTESEITNALNVLGIKWREKVNNDSRIILQDSFITTPELHDIYVSAYNKASNDVKYSQAQLDSKKSSINPYLGTWLQTEPLYNQMKDERLQKVIQEMLFHFDWSTIPEDIMNESDPEKLWNDVSKYLRENLLFAINKVQDNKEISTALSSIFTDSTVTPDEKANDAKQMQDYFGSDSLISTSLQRQQEETQALQNQYANAISKYGNDEKSELEKFFKENSINDSAEIDHWNEITASAKSAAEAIRMYHDDKKEVVETPLLSFDQAWEGLKSVGSNAKNVTPELLQLARAGELSDATLKSNADYQTLLKETGLSAREARQEIMSMLSEQERLAAFGNQMDNLRSLYNEFQEKGFVTAGTLDNLPDVFKEINNGKDYDLFSKIIGNPKSGKKKIKQAFDDIVSSYINDQDILLGAEKNKGATIANLEDAGITNAEDVVNSYIDSINLIRAAETEFYNLTDQQRADEITKFQDALLDKNSSFNEACNVLSKNNAALMRTMGDQYADDYANWLTALDAKAKAWNEYAEAFNNAVDTDHDGKADTIYHGATSSSEASVIRAKEREARKADKDEKEAGKKIKKYGKIDLNLSKAAFNPKDSGSGTKAGNETKTQSTQVIDWIERRLSVLQSAIDKTRAKFENLFNWESKNSNIDDQIKQTTKLMNAQAKAAQNYKKKAKSVDLSSDLKKNVRQGKIKGKLSDLIATYGEDKANKISKYQDYIDKAKEAEKANEELLSSLISLNEQKLDNITAWYDTFTNQLEAAQSKIQSTIDLTSKIHGFLGQSETGGIQSYQNLMDNQSSQISQIKAERKEVKAQYNKTRKSVVKSMKKAGASKEDIAAYKEKINAERDAAVNQYNAQINQIYSDMLDTASAMANIPLDNAEIAVEKLSEELNNISTKINTTSGYMDSLGKNVAYAISLYKQENANKAEQVSEYSKAKYEAQVNKENYENELLELGYNPASFDSATDLNSIADETLRNAAANYLTSVNALSQANTNYNNALNDYVQTVSDNAKKMTDLVDSWYDANRETIARAREIGNNEYETADSLEEKIKILKEDNRSARENLQSYYHQSNSHKSSGISDFKSIVYGLTNYNGWSYSDQNFANLISYLKYSFGYNFDSEEQNGLHSVDDDTLNTILELVNNLPDNNSDVARFFKTRIWDLFKSGNESLHSSEEIDKTIELEESKLPVTIQNNFVKMFNAIAETYDRSVQSIQDNIDQLNNAISLAEANGKFITSQYYDSIEKEQRKELSALQEKSRGLQKELAKGLADGSIKEGSDAWYDLTRQIVETNKEIDSMNVSIAETAKNARQAKYDLNDWARGAIDTLNDEADFYQKLVSREKQFDNNGNLTDYGKANIALSLEKMSNDVAKNQSLTQELRDLDKEYAGDRTNKEYLERRKQLTNEIYSTVDAYYAEQDAVKSLVEEGLNKELDALDELINKYTEALDEAKSLRDFERQITDITKRRDSLMKQKKALEGNDSEEARAKLQAINVELQEAQQDLDDAYYDKYIEDQKAILEDMNEDMQTFIEEQFANLDYLIDQLIDGISGEGGTVFSILNEFAKHWEIDISDALADSTQEGDYTKTDEKTSNAGQNATDAENNRSDVEYKKQGGGDSDERDRNYTVSSSTQSTYPGKVAQEERNGTSASTNSNTSYSKTGGSSDEEKERNSGATYSVKINGVEHFFQSGVTPKDIIRLGIVYDNESISSGNKEFDQAFQSLTNNGRLSKDAYTELCKLLNSSGLSLIGQLKNNHILDGFATGGIGQLIKKSGEDGIAFVRNGEGFVSPEDVPKIQALLDTVPVMNHVMDTITPLQHLPAPASQNKASSVEIGTIQQTFELPNVTDTDSFIKEVKTNPKMGRFIDDMVYSRMTGDISKVTQW